LHNSSSYYDKVDRILNSSNTVNNDCENLVSFYRITPRVLDKLKEKQQEEITPEYLQSKLIEDMPLLEKFLMDSEFRNKLLSADFHSHEYFQLSNLYGLVKKVKEKLELPKNATIRFENVKCSKRCKHTNHQYFYAYFWDSPSKKLKKKYIGKHLPSPYTFELSIVN
jgi:hypothetical protein